MKSQIEKSTRKQNDSQLWHQERTICLTASPFGQVCKMRANTSSRNSVYNILYSTNVNAKSLEYKKDMEIVARKKVETILNLSIKTRGLLLDLKFPFLTASPGTVKHFHFFFFLLIILFFRLVDGKWRFTHSCKCVNTTISHVCTK